MDKLNDEEANAFYHVDEDRVAKQVESLLGEICIKMTGKDEPAPVHGAIQQKSSEWKVWLEWITAYIWTYYAVTKLTNSKLTPL